LPPAICSLRALYGTDGTQNATHGSDSPKSAVREIKFFFPNQVLEPLLDAEAAKLYITEKLQPALSRALTALAREKPSAEKFEAITFLANFLLTHNPNKPKIVSPDEWDPSVEEEDDESDFAAAQLEAAQASAAARAALRAASASPAAATQKGAGAAPPPTAAEDAAAGDASSAPALPAEAPARAASIRAASPTAAAAAAPAPPPSAPAAPAPAGGADADITDGFATDDADVLHAAATKVQATFRGHQARKEVAALQAQASPRTQAAAESAPSAGPGIILPPALPPTVLAVPNGVKDRPQVLRAVFAQLDRDGSGAIDREEFKAALGAMVSSGQWVGDGGRGG
jgi:nucleoside-diphosphate kinase